MKKTKGILGAILPFVYYFLIQFITSFLIMAVYGGIKGAELASQGITDPNEIMNAVQGLLNQDLIMIVSIIAGVINIIIFALWYYKKIRKENKDSILKVFEGKTICWLFILGISLQMFISMILNGIAYTLPDTFHKYMEHMIVLNEKTTILSFIMISIIAPISEEIIFRGVILNKAKKLIPFMYANILQSVLFGIIHGNLIQGIYAFCTGIIFGVLYEKYNSIYGSIILHMIFNISNILLGLIPNDILEKYSVAVWILMIISIPGIIYSLLKLKNEKIDVIESNEVLSSGI